MKVRELIERLQRPEYQECEIKTFDPNTEQMESVTGFVYCPDGTVELDTDGE